jgi:hypothetical protein
MRSRVIPIISPKKLQPLFSLQVQRDVFNVLGEKIITLFEGRQSTGTHQVSFNGNNLSSGIYFIQLRTEKQSQLVKALLLK